MQVIHENDMEQRLSGAGYTADEEYIKKLTPAAMIQSQHSQSALGLKPNSSHGGIKHNSPRKSHIVSASRVGASTSLGSQNGFAE
jgi:hypothetical protein